jgi:hypothetical protein
VERCLQKFWRAAETKKGPWNAAILHRVLVVRPAQLSSQSSCGMSVETGFVNKSVVLKTARPTRRWRILHRLGHRAALAATDGRAWTLRDCCWPRRRALFARPRELFSRNRPDPRTDLGRTRSGRTSSPFRRSDECSCTAAMGAFRIREVASLRCGRQSFRLS